MKLTDLILHIPNFLSEDQCKILIDGYEKREDEEWRYEACLHATHGHQVMSTFRSIVLNENSEEYELFYKSTEEIINKYHEYLDDFGAFHVNFRKALLYSHEYRLMKYYPGSWIHPHIDTGVSDPYVYASCTFNLNTDYTGGDFIFFKGKHRIKMGLGDAMIWPADYFWVHEVEEIKSGCRYSANSFLQCLPQSYKLEVNSNVKHTHPNPYNIRK